MHPQRIHRPEKENYYSKANLLVLLWLCRLRTWFGSWFWAWLTRHWLIARFLVSKLIAIFKSWLLERMFWRHHRLAVEVVETRTAFEHRARCMERSRSREPGLHLLILRRSLCLGLWGCTHRLGMMSKAAMHHCRYQQEHLYDQKNKNYYTDCKNHIQEFVVFHNLPLSFLIYTHKTGRGHKLFMKNQ